MRAGLVWVARACIEGCGADGWGDVGTADGGEVGLGLGLVGFFATVAAATYDVVFGGEGDQTAVVVLCGSG